MHYYFLPVRNTKQFGSSKNIQMFVVLELRKARLLDKSWVTGQKLTRPDLKQCGSA